MLPQNSKEISVYGWLAGHLLETLMFLQTVSESPIVMCSKFVKLSWTLHSHTLTWIRNDMLQIVMLISAPYYTVVSM